MKKKIRGYNPITFQPVYEGEYYNRTCGDCGKERCFQLFYENEFGRFNHGVCFSCLNSRGLEECEGGLMGSPQDNEYDRTTGEKMNLIKVGEIKFGK